MSELFDIQVNAQKEKNFRDSRKKQEKNDRPPKIFLMEGTQGRSL